MTLRRSRAYGRIVRALESSAALERMTGDQRDALRDAADTLTLASVYDDATRLALATARAVLLRARISDCDPWIEQLATDLQDAGPPSPIAVSGTHNGEAGASHPSRPNPAVPR